MSENADAQKLLHVALALSLSEIILSGGKLNLPQNSQSDLTLSHFGGRKVLPHTDALGGERMSGGETCV